MNARLAPSRRAALARSALLLAAALVVSGAMYSINGPPTAARLSPFDEFRHFAPSLGHGLADLLTQTLALLGLTWLFREGLKVRL